MRIASDFFMFNAIFVAFRMTAISAVNMDDYSHRENFLLVSAFEVTLNVSELLGLDPSVYRQRKCFMLVYFFE